MATVSSGSTSERFGFVQTYGKDLGIKYLCDWLKVSRSGYYAWLKRGISARSLSDVALLKNIKLIFDRHRQTYGSPRVFYALRKQGIRTSKKRVARLMKESGLRARALKTYRSRVKVKHFYQAIENKRNDIGAPTNINQQWSGDVTYLRVGRRWYYLAVVLDLFSRRVIGWSFSDKKDTTLTLNAIKQALKRKGKKSRVMFHSDRGAEYRAHHVQAYLNSEGVESSMNRPGKCTDNAEVESFFHSLKADIIRGCTYDNVEKIRAQLRSYLNYFYNRQRLHSSLGYKTPAEFESALN